MGLNQSKKNKSTPIPELLAADSRRLSSSVYSTSYLFIQIQSTNQPEAVTLQLCTDKVICYHYRWNNNWRNLVWFEDEGAAVRLAGRQPIQQAGCL